MTKLAVAAALVAVISSPALAQNAGQSFDQVTRPYQYGQHSGRTTSDHRTVNRHSSNPAYDVYDTEGYYVGSDPDPLIRDELRRDYNGRGY